MIHARRRTVALLVAALGLVAACGSGGDDPITFDSDGVPVTVGSGPEAGGSTLPDPGSAADVEVRLDASAAGEPISPFILGVSSTLTPDEMRQAGITVNSWGGNPATRFNYEIGHAWNHGADFEFRNTNYGDTGDAARSFLDGNAEADVATRMAVPTLGWVARDDLEDTCSFPDGAGGCLAAPAVGDCQAQEVVADPRTANVQSTPEGVATWIGGMIADGYDIQYIAMDNEPELWGFTHYDVHPECPTYEEILEKYLAYATAVREVAPDARLGGPVACCWFDYWNIAPGPADDSGTTDFVSWFLEQVKAHDDQSGQRSLDVLDVHYYPQSGVFNEDADPDTNAKRLRSTRSLWDPEYVDESWIRQPIRFIPRMQEAIDRYYPGTALFISEWNFGADTTMNGALAIADVLGVYGREGVEAASYWRNPPVGSTGFFAFTMHGNYDGAGSRFGGRVVPVDVDDGAVTAYAALDETTGLLRVMLLNKDPETTTTVDLALTGFTTSSAGRTFTYGPDDPAAIVAGSIAPGEPLTLPASSITVVELDPSA